MLIELRESRSISFIHWIQAESSFELLHASDSASRKNDSASRVASPRFLPFERCRVGPVSSGVDSASLRVDSVMEGLGELFIQLGESKAIFLSSRTTRRVVHMTRRVG